MFQSFEDRLTGNQHHQNYNVTNSYVIIMYGNSVTLLSPEIKEFVTMMVTYFSTFK